MRQISLRAKLFSFLLLGFISLTFAQTTSPESLVEKHERHKNLTIREYNTDAKGKNRWMDHVTIYNDKGFKIEETEYATYGMKERVLFEYEGERCVKEVVFDENKKVSRIRKYEYNADGTKKTQYNYLPNGRLYSTKQYQYTN